MHEEISSATSPDMRLEDFKATIVYWKHTKVLMTSSIHFASLQFANLLAQIVHSYEARPEQQAVHQR